MNDNTIKFVVPEDSSEEMKTILTAVYGALSEKGYNPINQIVGYLLSEDPTYITNYNNARSLICKLDRDELLQELVKHYHNILCPVCKCVQHFICVTISPKAQDLASGRQKGRAHQARPFSHKTQRSETPRSFLSFSRTAFVTPVVSSSVSVRSSARSSRLNATLFLPGAMPGPR